MKNKEDLFWALMHIKNAPRRFYLKWYKIFLKEAGLNYEPPLNTQLLMAKSFEAGYETAKKHYRVERGRAKTE